MEEIIIEQCKGTKSGKDSKEFDVDHVSAKIPKVVFKLESNFESVLHLLVVPKLGSTVKPVFMNTTTKQTFSNGSNHIEGVVVVS